MANMSYCRFRNTLGDLRDCYEVMGEDMSADEAKAQLSLYRLCRRIADSFDEEDLQSVLDSIKAREESDE